MHYKIQEIRDKADFPIHASAKLIWQELHERGWNLDLVYADKDKLVAFVVATKQQMSILTTEVKHQLYTPLNPRQVFFITSNKDRTRNLLEYFKVKHPKNLLSLSKGQNFPTTNNFGIKVVVKPVSSYGGKGISFIEDGKSLLQAVTEAFEYSDDVSIEEFVEGDDFRLLVIDYKVVAVSKRRPAHIVGDGSRTVSEIILEQNKLRAGKDYEGPRGKISIDNVSELFGSELLESIPAPGENVQVGVVANMSMGGDSVDVTDIASKALIAEVERFCTELDLSVAGVDVMSTDISSDNSEMHNVIEVNGCPGLKPHLFVSEGRTVQVHKLYVDALEKYAEKKYNSQQ